MEESERQLTARFIGGLREPIQEKLDLRSIWDLSEAVSLATRVEQRVTRSSSRSFHSRKSMTEPTDVLSSFNEAPYEGSLQHQNKPSINPIVSKQAGK